MKKICYVVTLPITIKAFFIPQLKHLAKNGYEVTVICSPDNELQGLLGEKIRFIPLDIPRGISFLGSIKTISRLKKIFKKEKFDLVQYSTPNASFYSSIASKKAKIKVRNYHLMGLRYLGAKGIMRFILKKLEKTACKRSTHIECVSKSNLDFAIKEKLFPSSKGVVVFNGSTGGVDLKRFNYDNAKEYRKEKRDSLKISDDVTVYGFVGRITRDKGINELITSFERVREENNKVKLVLIGGLEEDNSLNEETLSKIEGGNDIIHLPQTMEIEKFFPLIDVLVLPSYREGFGNVVIEAEAMGVPVIVSDIPGPIDAMVDGETGIKVPLKDVDELTKAMRKALDFKTMGFDKKAYVFARENFDQEKLNERILIRKNELLS